MYTAAVPYQKGAQLGSFDGSDRGERAMLFGDSRPSSAVVGDHVTNQRTDLALGQAGNFGLT